MAATWQIAQLNIASALYPLDDPRMSGFVGQTDDVNALAERSPGFVWRHESDSDDDEEAAVAEDPSLIVNLSVWDSIESLHDFAYRSAHKLALSDRQQWFRRIDGAYQVLWWVPAGYQPDLQEAMNKLKLLDSQGPSPDAFTFKSRFPPPDTSDE